MQSQGQLTRYAHILGGLHSDLSDSDLRNFNTVLETRKLDAYIASVPKNVFQCEDGWQESSVQIQLPLDKMKMQENNATEFEVRGVFHCNIIDVITSVYQSDLVKSFNHVPFKEYWKPLEDMLPEHCLNIFIEKSLPLMQCLKPTMTYVTAAWGLKSVTVPILLYLDSTHLASFGNVSCWLVYMFFGSQSKYVCTMPTSSTCYHIVYMPKVSHFICSILFTDIVQSYHQTAFKISTKHTMAKAQQQLPLHCKRELIHAVLLLIINDQFTDAYQYRVVIECKDGHRHRLFPHILLYSADYPEKCTIHWLMSIPTNKIYRVLLSTIKSNADHLCPCCLVNKSDTIKMEMHLDMHNRQTNKHIDNYLRQITVKNARRIMYEQGVPISSDHIKRCLGDSLVFLCVSQDV